MDILEEARKMRAYIEKESVNLNDEDALDNIDVFPLWKAGVSYVTGDRVRYNETLYKVLQDHISQIDWTPDVAVSLYVRVDDPGEEWPEWRQPTGAHDAYALGAKVSHNGKHWISLIDANVYEPTEAVPTLWEEHVEPEPEPTPEPTDEWPEWEQPTAENPYMTGDKVTFEGEHYISLIDNNIWSPSAYPQGWEKQNAETN